MEQLGREVQQRWLQIASKHIETPWEASFIASVSGVLRADEELSDKRYDILAEMASRRGQKNRNRKTVTSKPRTKKSRVVRYEEEFD